MFEARILQPQDAPIIIDFEKQLLDQEQMSAEDREMKGWHASWRKESLEHYLPLGWSFGLWRSSDKSLMGYFIAQPILFMRGLTQTLWIERLRSSSAEGATELMSIAYKLGREKHLQNILVFSGDENSANLTPFQLEHINEQILQLKTAKYF